MNRKILNLAIPNIISNITVPLLGMADLMIVGSLGDFKFLAAIGVATAMFNLIYWNFSFLRMGTSGFTAQAYGARNFKECGSTLLRGLAVALALALVVLILQKPLSHLALLILNSSSDSSELAMRYFAIRIWAAPATISMYVLSGWFVGMQNAKTPMYIAILMNVVNIACSLLSALTLGMGIEGVALGTVISQYFGAITSIAIILIYYTKVFEDIHIKTLFAVEKMKLFFSVNRDIFFRTVCMCVVFTFFTSASSKLGDDILAVNTILMQLFIFFSYFMDGFAYAAEALVGRFVGANNQAMLKKAVRLLIIWGIAMALIFTLIYGTALVPIVSFFTQSDIVFQLAENFRFWIALLPLASFLAFLFDGIMVGATMAIAMRNSMAIATASFFGIYYYMIDYYGNIALWIAFLTFLFMRGAAQFIIYKYKIR